MIIAALVVCGVGMVVGGVAVRFIVPLLIRHWDELERLPRRLGVACVALYAFAAALLAACMVGLAVT